MVKYGLPGSWYTVICTNTLPAPSLSKDHQTGTKNQAVVDTTWHQKPGPERPLGLKAAYMAPKTGALGHHLAPKAWGGLTAMAAAGQKRGGIYKTSGIQNVNFQY
jgi:hypothetical protein